MKKILAFFLVISLVIISGCMSPKEVPEKPIGKGYLNMCFSNPEQTEYWQKTGAVLHDKPGLTTDRTTVAIFPACDNSSLILWEYKGAGDSKWSRITLQNNDGKSWTGWLEAEIIHQVSNETGTEWSDNYSSIIGLWDRSRQGNGAKIWYDFNKDGSFTFNYDMMRNRDDVQDRGSWTYLGNNTWELISNVSAEHKRTRITLDRGSKSFRSGSEYSSRVNVTDGSISPDSGTAYAFDPAVEQEIVYAKE
jgi:hypothetical protein